MYPYQSQPQLQYTIPPQQILQANGKASIDNLRLAPNSSVLIADTTAPIVWRCVSDGLGNVTSEPFDIIPHKSEEAKEKENIMAILTEMNARISKLEEVNHESIVTRTNKQDKWSADVEDV